jgi:hypothetical protein
LEKSPHLTAFWAAFWAERALPAGVRGPVRERIKVRQGTGIIVDGHRRYRFAKNHGKPSEVEELQFEDRLAAEIWMHRLQLSRRNLSPDQYTYRNRTPLTL